MSDEKLRAKAERMLIVFRNEHRKRAPNDMEPGGEGWHHMTDAMLAALKAEQPEECPEGFVDVPCDVTAWQGGMVMVSGVDPDETTRAHGNKRLYTVTVRVPVPQPTPTESLGVVEVS